MKKTLFAAIFFLLCLSGFAQQRLASIEITNSRRNNAVLELTCHVSVDADTQSKAQSNVFMIFFAADDRTANLKVTEVRRGDSKSEYAKFVRLIDADETLTTELSLGKLGQNLVVYPVVLQGDLSRFERAVILVDGEFSKINDALNVLYKSRYTPLAYSELGGL